MAVSFWVTDFSRPVGSISGGEEHGQEFRLRPYLYLSVSCLGSWCAVFPPCLLEVLKDYKIYFKTLPPQCSLLSNQPKNTARAVRFAKDPEPPLLPVPPQNRVQGRYLKSLNKFQTSKIYMESKKSVIASLETRGTHGIHGHPSYRFECTNLPTSSANWVISFGKFVLQPSVP